MAGYGYSELSKLLKESVPEKFRPAMNEIVNSTGVDAKITNILLLAILDEIKAGNKMTADAIGKTEDPLISLLGSMSTPKEPVEGAYTLEMKQEKTVEDKSVKSEKFTPTPGQLPKQFQRQMKHPDTTDAHISSSAS